MGYNLTAHAKRWPEEEAETLDQTNGDSECWACSERSQRKPISTVCKILQLIRCSNLAQRDTYGFSATLSAYSRLHRNWRKVCFTDIVRQ